MSKLIHLPVSDIYIHDSKRWLNKEVKFHSFLGFDTETFRGSCKLLADSTERYIYNPSFKECLDFLWFKASYGYYRAFWNLGFDISAILKLYKGNISFIEKLNNGEIVYSNDYKLKYIRPKMFIMSRGHKAVHFVDLFYMFKTSLDYASKTFLNDEKIDSIDGNKLNNDLTYWYKNLNDIIIYCIQDCKLTANLGNFLLDKVRNSGLPIPRFFTSHASLSKQYFRMKSRIPSIKYIPTNILDIATQCYYGGRFEVLKRGYFDDLYCYDINSAYPKTIEELPSLKHGSWYEVDKPSRKEVIGYYKVLFKIPKSYISPLIIKHKGLAVFPHGLYETWITWYEYDLLKKYILNFYKGYEYYPTSKEYYPFKDQIKELYQKKLDYKDKNEVFYWLYKIVMNALYGCFIERHKQPDDKVYAGILFNSVYASIITAKTRYKLLKDSGSKNWKHIVAFHTDSIITTKPIKNLKISNKLGDWSLEYNDKGILLKSGMYQIGSKIRRRGFSDKSIDWFELLEKNKNETKIKLPNKHVIKLAEALRRWHSIDQVNIFINQIKELDINSDKKRNWSRKFENCNDVLNNNITSHTLGFKFIDNRDLK